MTAGSSHIRKYRKQSIGCVLFYTLPKNVFGCLGCKSCLLQANAGFIISDGYCGKLSAFDLIQVAHSLYRSDLGTRRVLYQNLANFVCYDAVLLASAFTSAGFKAHSKFRFVRSTANIYICDPPTHILGLSEIEIYAATHFVAKVGTQPCHLCRGSKEE